MSDYGVGKLSRWMCNYGRWPCYQDSCVTKEGGCAVEIYVYLWKVDVSSRLMCIYGRWMCRQNVWRLDCCVNGSVYLSLVVDFESCARNDSKTMLVNTTI